MNKWVQRIVTAQPVRNVLWILIGLMAIYQVLPFAHWENFLDAWRRLPHSVVAIMCISAVVAYGFLHAWEYLKLKGETKSQPNAPSSSVLMQRILTAHIRRALRVEPVPIVATSEERLPYLAWLLIGLSGCIFAVAIAAPELFAINIVSRPGIAAAIFLLGLTALFIRTLLLSQRRTDGYLGGEIIKLIVGREYSNWLKPLILFLPAALTLYFPLSSIVQMSALHFIGLYFIAHMAGVLSRVPGGAGVFDGVFLIFAAKLYPPSQVFICLVAYRAVYYCLPLLSGMVAYLLIDIRKNQAVVRKTPWGLTQVPGQLFQPLVSTWLLGLAVTNWLGYAPSWVGGYIPAPPDFVAPYVNNLLSVFFLIVWHCHWRRIDLAYYLVMGCLMFSATLFALKAAVISCVFCLLMAWIFSSSRRYFYRVSALLQGLIPWALWGRYCLGGFLLITTTILLTQTNDIERLFVSQWLCSEVLSPLEKVVFTTAFFAGALAVHRLFTHCDIHIELPDYNQLQRYQSLIRCAPDTQCHLGLAGDKYLLFSPSGKSCLAFGKAAKQWIVMGDPVGQVEEFEALIWSLAEKADVAGASIALYKTDAALLPMYINMGMNAFKLGDEARVHLAEFNLSGNKKLNLRNSYNKCVKEGLTYSILSGDALEQAMPRLQSISDDWLSAKSAREKQFSLGFFSADYLRFGPVAVVWQEGQIVAFANLWCEESKNEIAIDLMRFGLGAPKRVMEFLSLNTLLWAQKEGFRWFNLGLAPLSGLPAHRLTNLIHKCGGYLYSSHSRFYNFAGVKSYKDKFGPQWHGRYLVVRHSWEIVLVLISVAKLISGGTRGLISKL